MTPRIRLASLGYAFRAENADNAAQAQNAAKVNSIEVSTTPQANKLLPLDANAKLPLSALGLKVYDSGWFEIVVNTTYTKPHNLGTTKVITLVYVSNHSDGSGICTLAQVQAYCYSAHFTVVALSTTEIKLRTGGGAPYIIDENGIPLYVNNPGTYARIIMLALE
jgi:hypothetical protein